MTDFEFWSIVTRVLTLILIAGSVLYAGRQFALLNRTNKSAHDWNRRKAAQDIAVQFGPMNPNRKLINDFRKKRKNTGPFSVDEIVNEIKDNNEIESAIHACLNYYEYLALGIKQGVYDEQLIRKFWGGVMARTYDLYSEYIIHIRKTSYPEAYTIIEEYVYKWKHDSIASPNREPSG